MPDDRFYELAVHALAQAGLDTNQFPLDYVKAALDTCKGKFKLFSELPAYAGFYFKEEVQYDPEAVAKGFHAGEQAAPRRGCARRWPNLSPSRPTPLEPR